MPRTRPLTERAVSKLTRTIRRQEAPPKPRTSDSIRGVGIRRTGHLHNLENTIGLTESAIASGASGTVKLMYGPHPIAPSMHTVTAYNYALDQIASGSRVLLTWIVMPGTGGFWLAVPLCTCTPPAPAGCTHTNPDASDPIEVSLSGITSTVALTSSVPAILNRTHSLIQYTDCGWRVNGNIDSSYVDDQGFEWILDLTADAGGWTLEIWDPIWGRTQTWEWNGSAPFDGSTTRTLSEASGNPPPVGLDWTSAAGSVNP